MRDWGHVRFGYSRMDFVAPLNVSLKASKLEGNSIRVPISKSPYTKASELEYLHYRNERFKDDIEATSADKGGPQDEEPIDHRADLHAERKADARQSLSGLSRESSPIRKKYSR